MQVNMVETLLLVIEMARRSKQEEGTLLLMGQMEGGDGLVAEERQVCGGGMAGEDIMEEMAGMVHCMLAGMVLEEKEHHYQIYPVSPLPLG